LAIPVLAQSVSAQTIVTPPVGGAVVAVPGGPAIVGVPVIIAAAIDTSGNADTARRALIVANAALRATPGYRPAAQSEYTPLTGASAATALKATPWAYPFTASDYQKIGKASKAPYAMTISVTPGTDGTYSAVAEMIRTKDGALTGYGKGTTPASATPETALDSAVAAAVVALGETATIPGVIVSKPGAYMARISLGTLSGARGGARVEYLGEDGEPVAFGTIVDIAAGEAAATVAPETAFPGLHINQRVRLVNNPSAKRALPDFSTLQEKDYKTFERNFGFSLALAGAIYYIAANN
jgi:hypothetical protein